MRKLHWFLLICVWMFPITSHALLIKYGLLSHKQEVNIGRRLTFSYEKQVRLNKNPRLNKYIQTLGARLLAHRKNPTPFKYSFKIVNTKKVNALAFPGGSIYVYKGLLQMCQDEAELAFILSHEIAHVERRHFSRKLRRNVLYKKLVQWSVSLGGVKELGRILIQVGKILALLQYNRKQEEGADKYGLRIMRRAGYDIQGSIRLFHKFHRHFGGKKHINFLSTHPSPLKRIRKIKRRIKYHKKKERLLRRLRWRRRSKKKLARKTSPAFRAMKKLLRHSK